MQGVAEILPFRIVHQDEALLVICKDPGIHVHPSALSRRETSLLDQVRDAGWTDASPAHRLDRAASGLVVFGLGSEAMRNLGAQFRDRKVAKSYKVILRGWIHEALREDSPVCMEGEGGDGLAATTFEPLACYRIPQPVGPHPETRLTLCRVTMEGGRRHQIRIHAARLAHPVLSDTSHGCRHHNHLAARLWPGTGLQLACTALGFRHPASGCAVEFKVLPPDLTGWLEEPLEAWRHDA